MTLGKQTSEVRSFALHQHRRRFAISSHCGWRYKSGGRPHSCQQWRSSQMSEAAGNLTDQGTSVGKSFRMSVFNEFNRSRRDQSEQDKREGQQQQERQQGAKCDRLQRTSRKGRQRVAIRKGRVCQRHHQQCPWDPSGMACPRKKAKRGYSPSHQAVLAVRGTRPSTNPILSLHLVLLMDAFGMYLA